jgi:hypothetical protein
VKWHGAWGIGFKIQSLISQRQLQLSVVGYLLSGRTEQEEQGVSNVFENLITQTISKPITSFHPEMPSFSSPSTGRMKVGVKK